MRRIFLFNSKSKLWKQPILSSDGVLGGSSFACYTDIVLVASNYAWYAFDQNKVIGDSNMHSASNQAFGDIIWYNPEPIRVTKLHILNQPGYDNRTTKTGNIYGSNTNGDWNLIKSIYRTSYSSSGYWDLDMSDNTNYYKYYKYETLTSFSNYLVINDIYITAYTE